MPNAKKKEKKELKTTPKINQSKDIEEKLIKSDDKFYRGLSWGIIVSLVGNVVALLFYDSVIKYFLKDEKSLVLLLIITAIILFIVFTFLKDKEIKARDGESPEEKSEEEKDK